MSSYHAASQRRHASLACNACRESKIKCNGRTPICSNCVKRNRECVYRALDKRKLPLRVAIELLSGRVVQLCRHITECGLQTPVMEEEKGLTLKTILGSLGLNEAVRDLMGTESRGSGYAQQTSSVAAQVPSQNLPQMQPPPRPPETPAGETITERLAPRVNHNVHEDEQLTNTDDVRVWDSYDKWLPEAADLPLPVDVSPSAGIRDPSLVKSPNDAVSPDGDRSTPQDPMNIAIGSDSNETLVDELSRNVGTLKIGLSGHTRLCGPSSISDIDTQPHNVHQSRSRSSLALFDGYRDRARVPEKLQDHLINLYFEWENPAADFVDKELYMSAKAKSRNGGDTAFYSEALCNAICSVGAAFEPRYHPTFVTFPKSLVEFFVDRARESLEQELDFPSVATVQALMVLSCHEVGNGSKTRGWLYSGMALRLAFDLALHLDTSKEVLMGEMSSTEAETRRVTFWSSYTSDQALGFQMGRPARVDIEDVTASRPSTTCIQDHGLHQGDSPSIAALEARSSPNITDHIRLKRLLLSDVMTTFGYILYGTSRYSKDALQKLNINMVAQLFRWKSEMHPAIQIDYDQPNPQHDLRVLVLHMQYHQNMIYAHRPWMSKHTLHPQPPRNLGYRHARGMCVHSANCIAKILHLYESQTRLRHIHHSAVHITSSAVLLLLFADTHPSPDWKSEDIVASLSTCFRALDEFAASWQSARQAMENLKIIQQKWQARKQSASNTDQGLVSSSAFDNIWSPTAQLPGNDPFSVMTDGNIQDGILFDPELDWALMPEYPLWVNETGIDQSAYSPA